MKKGYNVNKNLEVVIMSKDDKALVVKDNKLIEAHYKLTRLEQRIVLAMVSKIHKDDVEFKRYRMSIKDFLDREYGSKYDKMKEATERLMQKIIKIRKENSFLQVAWLSSAEYYEGEGTVELEFSPKLKPYLLQLKEKFTAYELKNIIQFNSTYSIRIYELLKQYETIKSRTITLDELQKMVGTEYKKFYDIKRFVIEIAEKELKEKADIYFTYNPIKLGRRVNSIEFHIKTKKKTEHKKMDYKSFVKYIRQNFINQDLGSFQDALNNRKDIKLSVNGNGKLYNKLDPNQSFTADRAEDFWKHLFSVKEKFIKK